MPPPGDQEGAHRARHRRDSRADRDRDDVHRRTRSRSAVGRSKAGRRGKSLSPAAGERQRQARDRDGRDGRRHSPSRSRSRSPLPKQQHGGSSAATRHRKSPSRVAGQGRSYSREREARHRRRRTRSPSPVPWQQHGGGATATRHRKSPSSVAQQRQSQARRSPHDGHHHHHRDKPREKASPAVVALPFSARRITKADYPTLEPLFAYYLDLQKQKDLWAMDEREARGRWKSFAGKWNRGELAEGWYDPDMYERCASEFEALEGPRAGPFGSGGSGGHGNGAQRQEGDNDGGGPRASPARESDQPAASPGTATDGEEDDHGPAPPGPDADKPRVRKGARSATTQDLALRDDLAREQREAQREQLRLARRKDRALQREALEALAPRAEPGTRERRLERKKEAGEAMRRFRERSPGGEDDAEGDAQLMGGGDGVDEHKRMRERDRARKSERQLRREAFERAKMEEMEHRRRAWREREEGTVGMLRELARQRFG